MKIPERISIAGITIKTVYDNNLIIEHGKIAEANFGEQIIKVAKNAVQKDNAMQAYVHEVVHFILFIMGKEELNRDEDFVDMFAHLAYHAIKSSGEVVFTVGEYK